MNPPRIFISSTIFDFKDLRSALKFYLESYGYTVLASEFNDFEKPLSLHSYDACLQSIDTADYFILLIGSRIGGWYNEDKKITITMQEYLRARENAEEGKLKILAFVRSEIWTVKEDRKSLARYLERSILEKQLKSEINNHESKMVKDAEIIFKFIEIVSKNKETKQAIKGETSFPINNWIHVFRDFKDIVDSLKATFMLNSSISEQITKEALLAELVSILKSTIIKFNNKLFSYENFVNRAYQQFEINNQTKHIDFIEIPIEFWNYFTIGSFNAVTIKYEISTVARFFQSSIFYNFNIITQQIEKTQALEAILLLHDEMRDFIDSKQNKHLDPFFKHPTKGLDKKRDLIRINTIDFLLCISIYARLSNITSLCKSLINHLNGEDFVMPKLFPKSPIPEVAEEMAKEIITDEDVINFLNKK
jgi:hypothetical protein